MLKFFSVLYLVLTVFPLSAFAADLEVKNVPELEKLFTDRGYDDYLNMPDNAFPDVFIKQFPPDFYALPTDEHKKVLFIKALIPLALRTNQNILAERKQLLSIMEAFKKNSDLTAEDNAYIEKIAQKYDVFTRFTGTRRQGYLLKNLLLKVDFIPPSLLIGIAAVETDFGSSRFVLEGNALYKELNWYDKEGLEPDDEKDRTYRIKKFASLGEAMDSFALKLNSHINFAYLWTVRQVNQNKNNRFWGKAVYPALLMVSNLPDFAALLDYTVTFYKLEKIDNAHI